MICDYRDLFSFLSFPLQRCSAVIGSGGSAAVPASAPIEALPRVPIYEVMSFRY